MARTTDARWGNRLHCTAKNPLPLPNFLVRPKDILSATSAKIFRFPWSSMPSLSICSLCTWSSWILWHLSTPSNSLCTILLGCVVRCSESAFLYPHYDDGSWSILQFSIPTQVFPTVQCQGKNIVYLKRFHVLILYRASETNLSKTERKWLQ